MTPRSRPFWTAKYGRWVMRLMVYVRPPVCGNSGFHRKMRSVASVRLLTSDSLSRELVEQRAAYQKPDEETSARVGRVFLAKGTLHSENRLHLVQCYRETAPQRGMVTQARTGRLVNSDCKLCGSSFPL